MRAVVREELRALLARLVDDAPAVYSTRRGHAPPGWSEEAWRAAAPTIPGAYRPGRWTVVPRAAFDAWLASRTNTPAQATAANDAPAWSPDDVLVDLGLRRAGGTR